MKEAFEIVIFIPTIYTDHAVNASDNEVGMIWKEIRARSLLALLKSSQHLVNYSYTSVTRVPSSVTTSDNLIRFPIYKLS